MSDVCTEIQIRDDLHITISALVVPPERAKTLEQTKCPPNTPTHRWVEIAHQALPAVRSPH